MSVNPTLRPFATEAFMPLPAKSNCKSCSRCRQVKSLDSFDYSRASRDNHHHRCKTCDRRRDQERRRNGSLLRSTLRWRQRHPQAVAAHKLVRRAIQHGELQREQCCICGRAKSHAHHEDYSKPLDVVWLCLVHHAEHHRFERRYGMGQTVFNFILEGAP